MSECKCWEPVAVPCPVHDVEHPRPMTWLRLAVLALQSWIAWAIGLGMTASGLLYLWFIMSQG